MTFIFKKHNINLHYEQWGTGAEAIICFHGFGRNRMDFKFLADAFPHKSIFSFELPFHEFSSTFLVDHIKEWQEYIQAFLAEKKIIKYDLWAYSLGGRFVLSALGNGQLRADQIILLAPDGIKNNIWYVFASKTSLGKYAFKWSVKNRATIIPMVHFLRKARLINLKMQRFLEFGLESEEKMKRVFKVWTHLNALYPNKKQLPHLLEEACNKVVVVYGKKDPVIPFKPGLHLQKKTSNMEVLILNRGHMLMMPSVYQLLIKRFY